MRKIDLKDVSEKVRELFIDACENIPENVLNALKKAAQEEQSPLGKQVIEQIIENAYLGREKHLPICQDTGVAVVYLTIGSEVCFEGDIYEAVNEGVRRAYTEGFLRKSVVRHPIDRVNTKDNTPAIVHIKMVPGDTFKIDVAPKGGGSENMSTVKMLIPADGIEGIKKLVVDTVFHAGGKPCPPIVVGVGIGGNFEKSALLAKEALFREIDDESADPIANKLEKDLLELINNTGVGPMGFGGTRTCLAVKVNVHPCHIASLPVAINIQCHSARHKSCTL
ncbi:MAG: fumarate hydratase [Clostridiales bacterium]|nr:fumarate hydratase [Clostridiales bacterium]